MPVTRNLLIVILCLAVVDSASPEKISFEREIAPILAANCYECHGPDAEQREAGLRLDDRSVATSELESGIVAIVPSNPEQSELLLRVSSHGDDRMPPEDAGEGLTDQQIALLRAWIEAGAHYQRHWAFSPLATNEPPRNATDWSDNPIDVFVESRLRRANLAPANEADRHTLVRRLYFDLCGLPPTPEQIQSFVEDGRPNAYAALVDKLLASPAYGERWGRHWLDVARYGDSNGGDENHAYPLAHHYRDYVIQAFNEDLPYDRFLTQQLAGDLLQPTDDEGLNAQRLTATGYLAIGMKILAEQDPVKKQADMVDEQIDTLGRTFLGLSLGCARCHDHKFNPQPELQRNDGKPLPLGGSRVTFAERGVRFVQVSHAHTLPFNNEQWDQHTHLEKGHSINVKQIDQPITALIQDLRQRGLLDDTLVIWGGEFGRTPTVQKGNAEPGRDHHPEGFTMWMAGGGVKPGFRYGATDEFGYYATEDRCTIHDFHATVLHILGLDHEKLTYPHAGRDFRLTDVHGNVAEKILT